MAKSNPNLFLKYPSYSEKFYYQFTDLFGLKALDVLVMQYIMSMFRNSASHGKHKTGKHGKCFYRHDRKLTGYYVSERYPDMAKHVHCHTSAESVKRSVGRLQAKGLLYRHRSYNITQIFLPIFDADVRKSLGDPDYKTVINFDEIYKNKHDLGAKVKKIFAERSKRSLRKYQNDLSRNKPVTNKPITNKPSNTVNTETDNQRLSVSPTKVETDKHFKPMDKSEQSISSLVHGGLTKASARQIVKFSVDYDQNPNVIYGLIKEARNSVIGDNKITGDITRFEKNKYIVNKMSQKLCYLFTLIIDPDYKYKTKYSNKYVDTSHYASWLVSSMEHFFENAFGLNNHKMVSPEINNDKSTSNGRFDTSKVDHKIMNKWKYDNSHAKRDPELINKISKKWGDKSDHTIIRDRNGNVKIDKPLPDWAKDGYKPKLHPTSLAEQRKVKKQLYDLDHRSTSKPTSKKSKPESDVTTVTDVDDTSDLYDFCTDEGMDQSRLRDNLVNYYEDKAEVDKQKKLNPGVDNIFDSDPKFNGKTVSELEGKMEENQQSIKSLKSKMSDDIIVRINEDAKSKVHDDMKEPETVPPSNDQSNDTDEDYNPF